MYTRTQGTKTGWPKHCNSKLSPQRTCVRHKTGWEMLIYKCRMTDRNRSNKKMRTFWLHLSNADVPISSSINYERDVSFVDLMSHQVTCYNAVYWGVGVGVGGSTGCVAIAVTVKVVARWRHYIVWRHVTSCSDTYLGSECNRKCGHCSDGEVCDEVTLSHCLTSCCRLQWHLLGQWM